MNAANIITVARIVFCIPLLFCLPLSVPFYILYLIAGFSDVLDGFVARKTCTKSELGAKLDTIADVIFVTVCLLKLIPVLNLSLWLYLWIAAIGLIKIVNIISVYKTQKEFTSLHTILNKATGALLFALPLTLQIVNIKLSTTIICIVATAAALHEKCLIWKGNRNETQSS